MAITTTESINEHEWRCGACGKLARGGLAVTDGNGRFVGECCASPSNKRLLADYLGDAPQPAPEPVDPICRVLDVLGTPKNIGRGPQ